ncbi:pirin family protein [uncultured Sunxiuqinia sp.]|uniref:pirin family protein n=1 Tax=uncultured Sunxiuqinia sp. TaxID=1573825 RepID=UPI002AA8A975|nr:pirin family protein [uncultured Sunxiuqinia sp.]
MKTIKKIHQPESDPIQDLTTDRVIPTRSIRYLDPFLFLNHHGPQEYPENNSGLPFGPHPHRGMETVTFIVDGDIAHFDSSGQKSVIKSGGVQWMTAGRGLIHSEVSSEQFKQKGGPLEILQLWVNLPAKDKMCDPFYKGVQKEQIPKIDLNDGQVTLNLVSGDWGGVKGPFQSGIGVQLSTIDFNPNSKLELTIPKTKNVFFYLIRGKMEVNGQLVEAKRLVEFVNDGSIIKVEALEQSMLLLGYALPICEPVVSDGPFVMNTQEEIVEAYEDYKNGKFGSWSH